MQREVDDYTRATESDDTLKEQDTMKDENRNEQTLDQSEGDWKRPQSFYMVCDTKDVWVISGISFMLTASFLETTCGSQWKALDPFLPWACCAYSRSNWCVNAKPASCSKS